MTNFKKMIATMITATTTSGTGKVALTIVSAILSFFLPVATFYYAICVFLGLNFVTGLWDDLKHKKKFSWEKFKVFLTRVFLYMLAVLATWIFEYFIINEFVKNDTSHYLTTLVSGMFALYEIQSFLCNCANISGNKIFIRISEKIKNFFNKNSKEDEKGFAEDSGTVTK